MCVGRAYLPLACACGVSDLSGMGGFVGRRGTAYVDAPVGSSRTHHVKRLRRTKLAKAQADTTGTKPAISSDAPHRPSPDVGTPEWEALQAEEARQQKRLDGVLKSICRGC